MRYCQVSDIEALMPQTITFDSTTKPTKTQVEQQTEFVASEMNARLKGIYVLPITGEDTKKILAYINALGTAADIAMPIATASGDTDRSAGENLQKKYESKIQDLLNFRLVLPDAEMQSNLSAVQVIHTNDEIAFTKASLDNFIKASKVE